MRIAQWSGRAYLLLMILEVVLLLSLFGNFPFIAFAPAHSIPLYLAAMAMVLVLVSTIQAWQKKLFRLPGRLFYSALPSLRLC